MRQINPEAEIISHRQFYDADNSVHLMAERYDYVLDAIDHITAKLHLLAICRQREIPVIASMGAAAKLDPTRIKVADISETHTCGMARSVRKLLRQRGINSGIKTVFSTEEHNPAAEAVANCQDSCICPNKDEQRFSCVHRRVILGSSAHIPGIFGLTMAGEVVRDLLKTTPAPGSDNNNLQKLYSL
jgi:tRNA A37 threonylcarbamoyladenosine dehydratase